MYLILVLEILLLQSPVIVIQVSVSEHVSLFFDIAFFRGALQEPDKYRGRCSNSTIGLSTGSPMEDLEKELKELKGFATP